MSKPFGRKEERVLIRRPLRNKFTRRARSKSLDDTEKNISAGDLHLLRDFDCALPPFPPSLPLLKLKNRKPIKLLLEERKRERRKEGREGGRRKKKKRRGGGGGGKERRASQLAHTSLVEERQGGDRGAGPALATCYYIRGPKYACITHAHARVHVCTVETRTHGPSVD